ncbi:hypothetical protein DYI24_23395 [Rhodopseudomonas sp. BR0C11]|uniref:hypothetical protein n=1 Tax=Rhodopseudomonas palustris TaxID=1076 RepID=UPI00131E3AB3|nr:hypothetical protein [Rhodopseudomonas palustris]NEV79985.1 hypothetical protein [Rhodopseudomonas sp. BR0C11]
MLLRDGTRRIKQKAMFKKKRSMGAKMAAGNKIISEARHGAFARCTEASLFSAPIVSRND